MMSNSGFTPQSVKSQLLPSKNKFDLPVYDSLTNKPENMITFDMEKDHNKTALKAKLFAELKLSWFPVTIKYNYHS